MDRGDMDTSALDIVSILKNLTHLNENIISKDIKSAEQKKNAVDLGDKGFTVEKCNQRIEKYDIALNKFNRVLEFYSTEEDEEDEEDEE